MTRARLIVLVAAVLAAAAVGLFLLTRSAGAGPLAWPAQPGQTYSWHNVNYAGVPVKSGQIGVTTLYLHRAASSPAVLLDVRPLHAPDAAGLTIRYAATTGLGLSPGGGTGWNPHAWRLHPLAGFVVQPRKSDGITVGASAKTRGVYFLHGFVVDYRIGSTHYSAPLYQGLELCVARGCPGG